MSRRKVLSDVEKEKLLEFPSEEPDIIRYYTLTERDISVISQHRGDHNRIGFAIQLCSLRFPGISLTSKNVFPKKALLFVTKQLNLNISALERYSQRKFTKYDHLLELQSIYGYKTFSKENYIFYVKYLSELAIQTDRGIILAKALINDLRNKQIIIPAISVIERICSRAITNGNRNLYKKL